MTVFEGHSGLRSRAHEHGWSAILPAFVLLRECRAMYRIRKACEDLRAQSVQDLRLNAMKFGDEGAIALSAALQENTSLTTLHLSVGFFSRRNTVS